MGDLFKNNLKTRWWKYLINLFNKLKKLFFRKNKDILKEDVDEEVGTNDLVLCDRETGNKVHIVCQKQTIELKKQ